MKEISLNILDIAENSYKARASLTEISLSEKDSTLTLVIKDNGHGMTEEILRGVTDPFYTTRTTRRVGLGLPLLKMATEQTGGTLTVKSRHESLFPKDHGTEVCAVFHTDHIDCAPLGDVVSTVVTLIQGHPDCDLVFTHSIEENKEVSLDTREMRAVLGDVPLDTFEVLEWIRAALAEQYLEIEKK